ncbi:hypothetical protein [Halorubrum sp. HHNYT27]|uniref:hypothetical protein n=1 Tax=Halorubrum sp. HHNYT27 TaxID=3402275 RepID=UPI003EBD149B
MQTVSVDPETDWSSLAPSAAVIETVTKSPQTVVLRGLNYGDEPLYPKVEEIDEEQPMFEEFTPLMWTCVSS